MYYAKAWKWFLLSFAVSMAAAYLYYSFQAPVYLAESRLLIKDEKKGISEQSILKELDIFTPKKVVENEIEVLKSYTLMNQVVEDLGLDATYYKLTLWGKREIFGNLPIKISVKRPTSLFYKEKLKFSFIDNQSIEINGETYPIGKFVHTEYGQLKITANKPLHSDLNQLIVKFTPRIKTVKEYQKKLVVEPTTKASTVLTLAIEDGVAAKGEQILDQLIKEYNRSAIIDKNKAAANTLDFVENRLSLLSKEITVVEKDVERYKSEAGITDLSSQASLFLDKVKENDAQLSEVNLQVSSLEDLDKYVHSSSSNRGAIPVVIGLNDPVLTGLVHKLGELELENDRLKGTVGPDNPMVKAIQSQIAATKNNISDNIQTVKNMLTTNRRLLQRTNQDLETLVRSIPHKERALLNITRQQAIKNELYGYLLQKREETALSYAAAISDSRTIDSALASSEPVKPIMRNIFILFGMLGLCLPVALLAIRDSRNNRIVRRSDIESLVAVPIIGEIIQSEHNDTLIINGQNRSVIGEQIRTLRTNLQFLKTESDKSQTILFTSSISGEGKSFLSINIGASLSLIGYPTVILEFDMRKPRLEKILNKQSKKGLSHYLINEAELDDILQPIVGYENYYLLPCGSVPPNPTEILSSPRLAKLFEELQLRFDYILIDTPPCTLVSDAQLLAPYADVTLFVVRHNVTPKSNMKIIESLYREKRFEKMYLTINGITNDEEAYYYNEYGNYYENEEDSIKELEPYNDKMMTNFFTRLFHGKSSYSAKKDVDPEPAPAVSPEAVIHSVATSYTENSAKVTSTGLIDSAPVAVTQAATKSKKHTPAPPLPVDEVDGLPARNKEELEYLAVAGNYLSETKALTLLCTLLQNGYPQAFILKEEEEDQQLFKVIALSSNNRNEVTESLNQISKITNKRALVVRNKR